MKMLAFPRINQGIIADICERIGVCREDGNRLDAGETAFLARQLEFIITTVYETKFAPLRARQFIPVNSSIPSGAETYTYMQWTDWGMAEIIHSYSDDLPTVGRTAQKLSAKIHSIGNGYKYSIQDLRAALFSGMPLTSDLAVVARRMIETKIDQLAATGDVPTGLTGLLNNANVPLVTLPNGGWPAATAADILEDLNFFVQSIVTLTKQTYAPDTLLLDLASWNILTTMPASAVDPTMTVMKVFLANNPYIKNIDSWWRLDTADAAGTGPRIVTYLRSPEVAELIIPQEFEQFPPQPENLMFKVPCHARCGAVSMKFPMAVAYADNAN